MYRSLVVALLLTAFAVRAPGQSMPDTPQLPISRESAPDYYVETTTEELLDSAESVPQNATALRTTSRNHDELVKDYMRLARTYDNNGNLTAARVALEKMRHELSYVDDPRSTASYHMQLGLLDYSEDQFDEAVVNLTKASKMYEEL